MFSSVKSALNSGDLLFGQLETTVTERGERAPNAKLAMRTNVANANAVADCGFDVMSFAGNHCLDLGETGFNDTLQHMEGLGVRLCGAGPDLTSARKPSIVKCGDLTIAFLAYSSILPEGYAASSTRPGCAPMRAHTSYEMIEHDQPGTPPRILTRAHREDLANLVSDIKAAKQQADFVVMSIHWGIHITPIVLADYQRDVAHAAIDAGAGAILGHHPHILKGVEFYKGCPIFYSMGNFAIEQPQAFDPAITQSASFKHLLSLHPDKPAEGIYVLPDDTRMSMIVKLKLSENGVEQTLTQPVMIDDNSIPRIVSPDHPDFQKIAAYLGQISTESGLALNVEAYGAKLVLSAG